jgi:hypothetical protein
MLSEIPGGDFNTALVVVGGGILAQIVTAVLSWMQSRKNGEKTDNLKHELNSRLTELLEVTRSSAHAAGKLEGEIAERNKNSQI